MCPVRQRGLCGKKLGQKAAERQKDDSIMAIPVKLEAFEGPLDLLLHLIEKNKIDIYDIPIVEITEQYLDYIRQMETEDMNVMSEFLVMAATLIDIKCKMLLPKEVNEDGEEEDPRAELVQKLLEYKMYKYMSFELRDKQMYPLLRNHSSVAEKMPLGNCQWFSYE